MHCARKRLHVPSGQSAREKESNSKSDVHSEKRIADIRGGLLGHGLLCCLACTRARCLQKCPDTRRTAAFKGAPKGQAPALGDKERL